MSMKKIISRIIHLVIMPCSEATLMMERKQLKELSPLRSLQLSLHLHVCKFCAAYYKKLTALDNLLSSQEKSKEKTVFQPDDIQCFKEELKRKINE